VGNLLSTSIHIKAPLIHIKAPLKSPTANDKKPNKILPG
jgi:hypothetical protein